MRSLFLLAISALLLAACGTGGNREANLPIAAGSPGDLYLFMDSAQWKGKVGEVIDSIFNQEMIGLPREEGIFRMSYVDPRKMNFILKQRRNIIFLTTLDKNTRESQIVKSLLTPEQLDGVKNDTSKYLITYKNVYARDQQVMFLLAQNDEQMIGKLRDHSQKLIDFFNKAEHDRLTATLFDNGTLTGVTKWLKENFQVEMTIPFGYKLVQNEQDFVWVRQINSNDDKDIFIARTEYTSLDQFKPENLIKYRNEIARKYLYEDPDQPDTYLVTETDIPYKPVVTKEVNFNGNYAVEMRGLWRTNTHSMGGPFLAYAMTDKATGKFFYIEGFVYGPSKDQREMMRQMETVLYTFKMEAGAAAPTAKD